jgi:hypothetical protein
VLFDESGRQAAEGHPPKWMVRPKYLVFIGFLHVGEKPAKHAALPGR